VPSKYQYIYSAKLNDDISNDDSYLSNIPLLLNMGEILFHPKVTFLVGENGSGKSTLLEALAVKSGFNPEGGTKFFNYCTRESHSKLHEYLIIHKHHVHPRNHFFLRAESFYNTSTEIDRLDKIMPLLQHYGGKSLHEQSHGESFFSLFMHKFGEDGLYILDEPEAALSPNRQMAILARMNELTKQNSQFIIATHSPILLSYPNAIIYQIENDKLREVKYEEAEIYETTKYFLNHYKNMHDVLFK